MVATWWRWPGDVDGDRLAVTVEVHNVPGKIKEWSGLFSDRVQRLCPCRAMMRTSGYKRT